MNNIWEEWRNGLNCHNHWIAIIEWPVYKYYISCVLCQRLLVRSCAVKSTYSNWLGHYLLGVWEHQSQWKNLACWVPCLNDENHSYLWDYVVPTNCICLLHSLLIYSFNKHLLNIYSISCRNKNKKIGKNWSTSKNLGKSYKFV